MYVSLKLFTLSTYTTSSRHLIRLCTCNTWQTKRRLPHFHYHLHLQLELPTFSNHPPTHSVNLFALSTWWYAKLNKRFINAILSILACSLFTQIFQKYSHLHSILFNRKLTNLFISSAHSLEIPQLLLDAASRAFTDPATPLVDLQQYTESLNSTVSGNVLVLQVNLTLL